MGPCRDVLAKRLAEPGLDDYEKVAAAGEEGLMKMKVISSLEKVETKLRTRGKRAARGLA
jgi:hypothetical protein